MKYENITEMKIGSTVSGSAGTDEILYYISGKNVWPVTVSMN